MAAGFESGRRCSWVAAFAFCLSVVAGPAATAEETPFPCGADQAAAVAPTPDGWTLGRKSVLYMRVRFADQAEEPETKRSAKRKMAEVNRFFVENSYGAFSLKTKITRTYVLPKTDAEYAALGYSAIRDDALAAALADRKNWVDYDLDVIQFAGGPSQFGGVATINGRGCWLRNTDPGSAIHELGHNLGLYHANGWITSDESVIGPGIHVEYADPFDTMGLAVGGEWHFNARNKALLRWLGDADVETATANGSYRIFAHDDADSAGRVRALKIPRDSSLDYWLELRQLFTVNPFVMNGAGLRRARLVNDAVGTQHLDTTAALPDELLDAPLLIGRTFSDPEAGIHVTPVGKGGTEPESLDLVVNLGAFPGNQAPSVTITASTTETEVQTDVGFEASAADPDGDALAYSWDFGPGSFGTNSASVTTRWPSEGEYVVRCTVSDMKGGTASASVVVSVGLVTTFQIRGTVTADGVPLEGVHVHNGLFSGDNRGSYTDSDGTYVIAGVEAGEHTFFAVKPGYTLAPSGFANPVVVGPDASGIDFVAAPTD